MARPGKSPYEARRLARDLEGAALLTPRCRFLTHAVGAGGGWALGTREAEAIDGMKAANKGMGSALRSGAILAPAAVLAALSASFVAFGGAGALAQNAECARLQQAIAARRSSGGGAA